MVDVIIPKIVADITKAAFPPALRAFQERQAAKAQEIIRRRLAAGKYWAISDDKAAAALWRYMRAAQEGSARRNLELLAEALVTGAADAAFAPDEFKRLANRLDDLSREEVLVLAAFVKARASPVPEGEDAGSVFHRSAVAAALAFGVFKDRDAVLAVMSALSRTGWILPVSGWGSLLYEPTAELDVVARLVNFDEAASREFDGSDLG